MGKNTNKIMVNCIAVIVMILLGITMIFIGFNSDKNSDVINNNLVASNTASEIMYGYNGNVEIPLTKPNNANDPNISWISTQEELKAFLEGNVRKGILTNNITLNWGANKTSTTDFAVGRELDGNGYTITIEGVDELKPTLYKKSEHEYIQYTPAGKVQQTDGEYDKNNIKRETYIAGGLVRVNQGSIYNTKFIWNSTNKTYPQAPDNSTKLNTGISFGFIAGLNFGTIENCSMTLNNDYEYKVQFSYNGDQTWNTNWKLRTLRYSVATIGAMVGSNVNTGKILKCKIDLAHNFKTTVYGNNWNFPRVFTGGIAGTNNNGALILDTTCMGSGNIYARAIGTPWGKTWDQANKDKTNVWYNSFVGASGIVAGSCAVADNGDPDGDAGHDLIDGKGTGYKAITACYESVGFVDGVVSTWNGKAYSNHGKGDNFCKAEEFRDPTTLVGTDDNKDAKPYHTGGTAGEYWIEDVGTIVGLAGNWAPDKAISTVSHVYYMNYAFQGASNLDRPKLLAARNWGPKNALYRGSLVVVENPKDPDKYVTTNFDLDHKLNVVYGTKPIERVISETETIIQNNSVVWEVDFKINGTSKKISNPYLRLNGLKDTVENREWKSSGETLDGANKGIPDEIPNANNTYPNNKYEFSAKFGQMVVFSPEFNEIDPLSEVVETEQTKTIYYKDKEFDGTKVVAPQIKLYADLEKKLPINEIGIINDPNLYVYLSLDHENTPDNNSNVGEWGIKFKTENNNKIFFTKVINGINYVAYAKDAGIDRADAYMFKRNILPKNIICTIKDNANQPITSKIVKSYNNSNFGDIYSGYQFNRVITGLVSGYSTVDFNYDIVKVGLEGAHNIPMQDVGLYKIKANELTGKDSRNYVIKTNNFTEDEIQNNIITNEVEFEITKAKLKFENPTDITTAEYFVYDGNSKVKGDNLGIVVTDQTLKSDVNNYYIKHSNVFEVLPELLFYFDKTNISNVENERATDKSITDVGWFDYEIFLINPNFELYDGNNKKVQSVKYSFYIRPYELTLEQGGLNNIDYSGSKVKLKVNKSGVDNVHTHVLYTNKPEKGTPFYLDTLYEEIKPQGAETLPHGIARPGIDAGDYKLTLTLNKDTSYNYKLTNTNEQLIIERFIINPLAINILMDGQEVNSLKAKYDKDSRLTENAKYELYTGYGHELHKEKIKAKTDNSLAIGDTTLIRYAWKYVKDGEQIENAFYTAPVNVGIYNVYVTMLNRADNNRLSYTVTDKYLFDIQIVQKEITVELQPWEIQYGDTFESLISKKTLDQFSLADIKYVGFEFTNAEDFDLKITEPNTYNVKFKGIVDLKSKFEVVDNDNNILANYKITYTVKDPVVLTVIKRTVSVDFEMLDTKTNTPIEYDMTNGRFESTYNGVAKSLIAKVNYNTPDGTIPWTNRGYEECLISIQQCDQDGLVTITSIVEPILDAKDYYYAASFAKDANKYFTFDNQIQMTHVLVNKAEVVYNTTVGKNSIEYGDTFEITPEIVKGEIFARDKENITETGVLKKNGVNVKDEHPLPGDYTVGVELKTKGAPGYAPFDNYIIDTNSEANLKITNREVNIIVHAFELEYGTEINEELSNQFTYEIQKGDSFVGDDLVKLEIIAKGYDKQKNAGQTYSMDVDIENSQITNKEAYNLIIKASEDCAIQKKKVTVKAFIPEASYTYNGLAVEGITLKNMDESEVIENYKLFYTLQGKQDALEEAIDAGTYTISAKYNDNYDVTVDGNFNTLTIGKKTIDYQILNELDGKEVVGITEYGSHVVTYKEDSNSICKPVDLTNDKDLIYERDILNGLTFGFVVEYNPIDVKQGQQVQKVTIVLEGQPKDNYTINTVEPFGIAQIGLNTLENVSLIIENNIYNCDPQRPKFEGIVNDDVDIYGRIANTENEFVKIETGFKNVGEYQIQIKVKQDKLDNYGEVKEIILKDAFIISPKEIEIIAANNTIVYGTDIAEGTILYDESSLQSLIGTDQISDLGLTATAHYTSYTDGVGSKNAKITYEITNNNYKLKNSEAKIIINPQEVSITKIQTVDSKDALNYIYDGNPKSVLVVFDKEVQSKDYEILYKQNNNPVIENKAINAGNYSVEVVLNNNYTLIAGEAKKDMIIAPLEVVVTMQANQNLEYTGEAIDGVSISFKDKADKDITCIKPEMYTITYTLDEINTNELINAGDGYVASFKFNTESNFKFEAVPDVSLNVSKKKVSITGFESLSDIIYNGQKQNLVKVTFDKEVVADDYSITYTQQDVVVDAINAGTYMASIAINENNLVLVGELPEAIQVVINMNKFELGDISHLTIDGHYNIIKVVGNKENSGLEFSIDEGLNWKDSGEFDSDIAEKTEYEMIVRVKGNENYMPSDSVAIGSYKTGMNPNKVNNAIKNIGATFEISDIAILEKALRILAGVNQEDLEIVDMTKVNTAKAQKETLVNSINEVVNEAQIVAGKASGKKVDGVAAAVATSMTLSVAGIALAIAKRKMLL